MARSFFNSLKSDFGLEIFAGDEFYGLRFGNFYLLQSLWIDPFPRFPFDHLKGSESHQLNYFVFFDTGLDRIDHSCYRFLGFCLADFGPELLLYGFN
jgi:hypothetical protein